MRKRVWWAGVLTSVMCAQALCAQTKMVGPPTPPPVPEEGRAHAILRTALEDKNPDTRKQAVAALGLIGPREPYISQIATALADKDLLVRMAAVASLVDLKDKGTAELLNKALQDPAPEVSFAAAQALLGLDDPRGREALLAILRRDAKTQSSFLTAQKRDTLRMLHTPRTLMVFVVKQGVGFAPVPGLGAGVSSLQDMLAAEGGVTGRASTALLLGKDRSPEVLDALKDALSDKDGSVRAAVVHAVALRDDPALASLLVGYFDDPKENVRLRAAAGYLRLSWLQTAAPPKAKAPAPGKKK
jgi:HEAT repeat protein